MADGLNEARALRAVEIINDYRTLLVHIFQQNVQIPSEEASEEGYRTIREGVVAAQALKPSNYNLIGISVPSNLETERAELQSVILEASARRATSRQRIIQCQRPGVSRTAQLEAVSNTFHQEMWRLTDQYVVADLRAADTRANHWLADDPSLPEIVTWIHLHL
ncbi:hypothetical protein ASPFODRAFT_66008 [Aspergillus luchuensis CBS 106.47]|uniref:Uncharacterized protein n=1 Tax=Aspergillus luchuensis (strain CBS 106.47) TaxID=1137211 RepID=A0A1M3SZF9_ASPLC|nr:hypothetical protein ASPFODRAFT_66008 [Aspergillus luchuensis CBS 106.47]